MGREIGFVLANILSIAVVNQLYLNWLLGAGVEGMFDWTGMILITFLVGIFPTAGSVIGQYIRQLKKYQQGAAELAAQAQSTPLPFSLIAPHPHSVLPTPIPLLLVADNEKDSLTVPATSLLFVESSDNYCTVVYLKNELPVKMLLRSSLTRLEGQVRQVVGEGQFIRCHRSYLVNLNQVERVTGNAQGYKLYLGGGQFQVPVSRQYNGPLQP